MRRLSLLLLLLVSSCALGAAPPPTLRPTATTVERVVSTPVPTVGRLASAVVTDTPAPTVVAQQPTPTSDACTRPEDPTTRHTVQAAVSYVARQVDVQQTIRYTNMTDSALPVLALNVEPNRWLETFTLNKIRINDAPGQFTLTGRRLDVTLVEPLRPDCTVKLELGFTLTIPAIIGGRESFRGYFGASPRQMNLGHWLPTVIPFRDGDWLFHETVLIGEQIVLDPAHWDVTLTVDDPDVMVAAPGTMAHPSERVWRFQHRAGRDFAASLSPVFRVEETTGERGTAVAVYTMPDATVPDGSGGWINGGEYAAKITAESLDLYADAFGDYPHERMVIVQGDFPDGMEFSGFAFVSTDWFVGYDGTPAGYLMLITVHEVAHQWWYDLVGSNQALAPWLDEALSTYSEYLYIEAYYPELADWWWYFRVNRLNPQGNVDSAVYEFDQIRPYINAVYLRGVLMFHEMRLTLGDEAFFEWLSAYTEANTGRIATADALWAALTPEQFEQTAFTRASFLRNPGVR